MTTVLGAVQAIQDVAITVTGIKQAPDYPPEQINEFPFALCYPGSGSFGDGPAGSRLGLHTIILEIHTARGQLPYAVAAVIGYGDAVTAALLSDRTLARAVDCINGPITYTFGPLGWGGQDTIGWRFSIPVKQIN